jgi:Mn-dependent DtxR family transcriptional regulator
MRDDIIAYFRIIPAASAEMVASELGFDPREVQNILHELDDNGHLLMRNGFYRLSEAEKSRAGEK